MGVVLQARDLRIRRTVAMKVMKASPQFSRESVLRFIDEAQLTGQLEHPNIVPVYELGIDESGETFYTMKYVKGITLDDVLRGLRHHNPETSSRSIRSAYAADDFSKDLRRRGLRAFQGRRASRPEAGERHDRRLRRGARHGLGSREKHHRRASAEREQIETRIRNRRQRPIPAALRRCTA